MSDKYRPTVGDRVILLDGGSDGTLAKPPLQDGQIYTIQQDDEDQTPYQLVKRQGSFVREIDVELVEKASSN